MSARFDPIDEEMTSLAEALGALAPARPPIDRDRLMYDAGRAEGRRQARARRGWPAMAAGLAVVAAGEGALLVRRPPPRVIERVVVIREPARQDPRSPAVLAAPGPDRPRSGDFPGLGWTARDRLADQVIRYGLNGLPASPPLIARDDPEMRPEDSIRSRIDPFRLMFPPGDPS
jgi:hypothetical protein